MPLANARHGQIANPKDLKEPEAYGCAERHMELLLANLLILLANVLILTQNFKIYSEAIKNRAIKNIGKSDSSGVS